MTEQNRRIIVLSNHQAAILEVIVANLGKGRWVYSIEDGIGSFEQVETAPDDKPRVIVEVMQ